MNDPPIIQFANWEKSGATLMARVRLESGLMTTSDITAVSAKCTVEGSPATVTGDTTPDVADVIYNTPVKAWPWQTDEGGYNFRYRAPASFFPNGNTVYLVEIKFSRDGGGDFHLVYRQDTRDLQRS